jgi:hypothetical protein
MQCKTTAQQPHSPATVRRAYFRGHSWPALYTSTPRALVHNMQRCGARGLYSRGPRGLNGLLSSADSSAGSNPSCTHKDTRRRRGAGAGGRGQWVRMHGRQWVRMHGRQWVRMHGRQRVRMHGRQWVREGGAHALQRRR